VKLALYRHRTPPVWIKAGDALVVEVKGIGRLENPVVDESPAEVAPALAAAGNLNPEARR
jgi:hypothetical protein